MSLQTVCGPHVFETQRFSKDLILRLFELAKKIELDPGSYAYRLSRKILCALFYEPSTRTRLSFESAAMRLGGGVMGTEMAEKFSSAIKGETLEDTIRVIGGYCDFIVLRHRDDNAAVRAIECSSVPIINAGCGKGQHPTQALLDVYTIWRRLGRMEGLEIAMVGDLANGRTVRSLAYLLSKYVDVKMHFISPGGLEIGDDIKQYLSRHNVEYKEHESLEDVISNVDVLYVTRPQLERMTDTQRCAAGDYCVDVRMALRMKSGSIILHPLPRTAELSVEADGLPQAAYFQQARYGLYVRMALLVLMINESELFD